MDYVFAISLERINDGNSPLARVCKQITIRVTKVGGKHTLTPTKTIFLPLPHRCLHILRGSIPHTGVDAVS